MCIDPILKVQALTAYLSFEEPTYICGLLVIGFWYMYLRRQDLER